ncbi:unnamed protein product [Cladocopium goreaui]|uniref:Uncharacterized protein n=1 Tax=Cladocopium goreaui TaxID=2562237 RepID=A0A9P1CGB3_9DINO|nr:unnamed protein product [Cladocopium goreaui]
MEEEGGRSSVVTGIKIATYFGLLIRQGRLPEGGWQTASQLELHPLEPVQSTSTATMLLAQKHRRLVLKSQGVAPGRWWGGGRGKGYGGQEKGKKGDPGKGRGKGKGKGGKESSWGNKGESNPWKENKEEAVPSAVVTWKGTAIFKQVLGRCTTLDEVGRALAWVLFNCPGEGITDAAVRSVSMVVRGRQKAVVAMHRGPGKHHRSLFPMPLGTLSHVREQVQRCGLDEFSDPHFAGIAGTQVWQALSLGALNGLAGFDRAPSGGRGTERQKKAVENLGHMVQHALKQPFVLDRSAAAAEKELSGRFLTYTGEEVPKMQVLGKEQVEVAQGASSETMLESAWDRQGVVSSAKKKVVASMKTQELGAELDGGAVGRSDELTTEGATFASMDWKEHPKMRSGDGYYYAVSRLAPILEVVNTEFELDTEIAEWIQQEFEAFMPYYVQVSCFRTLFKKILSELQVEDLGFRPYSLRRGGQAYEIPEKVILICFDPALDQAEPFLPFKRGWLVCHALL